MTSSHRATFRRLPQPDWKKQRVVLTDPSQWKNYTTATCDLRPTYEHVAVALEQIGAGAIVLRKEEHPIDIWIRDWGPVDSVYFEYRPSYARNLYSQESVACARYNLDQQLRLVTKPVSLTLDGGNVVHNGAIAFVTGKVCVDNPHLSRGEIERAILNVGFRRVVFIPSEPNDSVGHADGILRFVREDVLLVNDYSRFKPLRDYGRQLNEILEKSGVRVRIVPFPWFTLDEKTDGIWSAEGVYVNFIMTAFGSIVPGFGRASDETARSIVEQLSALPAVSVAGSTLARLGGVFNCISLGV